jgi:MFS family permease
MALAAGSVLGNFTFAYMASAYLATYAHTHLGYSRNVILLVGVLGALVGIGFVAFSAVLSDRVGRRRMILVGWAACLPWSFVAIPLMDTGKPVCYAVAIVGMFAVVSIGYGPSAAFIPELFATRYRYSGTAVAINVAGIVGGAVPPLIARHAAGDLRRLGDRSHAGHRCVGQPGVRLLSARNQWNSASTDSKCW